MAARLRPEEAKKALKLVDFKTALFILSMLFRK